MAEAGPYRVLSFESLGSTNDEAMGRLRSGDPGGFFVVAREQSGGRGRQGRAWVSPPGNLYATLALANPAPLPLVPQLGFVAGVALAATLRYRLSGDVRLRIKWPNDMVFGGAKLAGILLESAVLPDKRLGCVIGFGVNCLSHPRALPYRATDLIEAGDVTADAGMLLAAIAASMETRLAVWDQGRNFATIRDMWLAYAAGLGERIKVAAPGRTLDGTFVGLDQAGRLMVETDAGIATLDAGDVFLSGSAVPA